MSTLVAPFNPAFAPLSAGLVNALATLEWTPGLSEAISAYTPPDGDVASVKDRNVVPAAQEQQERMAQLIDGIKIGEREVEQIPVLFAALRDSAMTAEALVAERNFYSAAAVFRDVAEAVLRVANQFTYYNPWRAFHERSHHRAVAGFLHERAADMFVLAGDHHSAAKWFGHSATLYNESASHDVRPEAHLWSRRAEEKLARAYEKTDRLAKAAQIFQKMGAHPDAVRLIRAELALRKGNPARERGEFADRVLLESMEESLLATGNFEMAAEEWAEEGYPSMSAKVWDKAAHHHHHRGNYLDMAQALQSKLTYLLAGEVKPDIAMLVTAVSAARCYERARADNADDGFTDHTVFNARLLLAEVLERLGYYGYALGQIALIGKFYQTGEFADFSLESSTQRIQEKITAISEPEAVGADASLSQLYETAMKLLKIGRIDTALGMLDQVAEATGAAAKLSGLPARAERERRIVRWLRAVHSADLAMMEGRKKELSGEFGDALALYMTAMDSLGGTPREIEQKVADEEAGLFSGSNGLEEMMADTLESIARIIGKMPAGTATSGPPAPTEMAEMLAMVATEIQHASRRPDRPKKRVGDLYTAAGDFLQRHGGAGDLDKVHNYYRQAWEAYRDNGELSPEFLSRVHFRLAGSARFGGADTAAP